jgi:hypothetical protein
MRIILTYAYGESYVEKKRQHIKKFPFPFQKDPVYWLIS